MTELGLKLSSKPNLKEKIELVFHIVSQGSWSSNEHVLECDSLRTNSCVAHSDLRGLNSKTGWDFSHRKFIRRVGPKLNQITYV